MRNRSKNKYIFFTVLGYLIILLPVLIYNAFNYEVFVRIDTIKLTFGAMLTFAMVGMAALSKVKNRTGYWMILLGAIFVFISEAAEQIGYSMLIAGGGYLIDIMIFKRMALYYKERWYEQIGRQVVHTRRID